MKSYNEMAKSALRRIDEENKALIKRKKMLQRTLIPSISLCLAAVIGFSVMGAFEENKGLPETDSDDIVYEYEYAIGTEEENDTAPPEDNLAGNVNDGSAKPDSPANPNKQSGSSQDEAEATEGPCILAIDVIYKGKTYIQTKSSALENYQKDKLLGDAKELSGYCKAKNVNGKVYSIRDNSEFLFIELDDGKNALLKEVK